MVSGHALQSSALDAHVGDFTAATAETYVSQLMVEACFRRALIKPAPDV